LILALESVRKGNDIMRKVRLNSGIVHDNARQLLDDTHYLGNCVKAIEMFVAAPGPDVDNAVKKTLIELQRQLDNVMGYMGMLKVNSAKLPVGSETASDDTAFLEAADVKSAVEVITSPRMRASPASPPAVGTSSFAKPVTPGTTRSTQTSVITVPAGKLITSLDLTSRHT
jgi:hypothetical protein